MKQRRHMIRGCIQHDTVNKVWTIFSTVMFILLVINLYKSIWLQIINNISETKEHVCMRCNTNFRT